ncbi:hypothetical protein BDD43_4082 [Mucilaginibacter gracilis]|uniref:Uncharacterized protein n=1 Tax=Mucilaginibacter gracilis TaxID=423350 RepID=A0A495J4I4_9SPHI|nr:hypothetical protein BDD43_4082 [Mucilaginibacter gracilis]
MFQIIAVFSLVLIVFVYTNFVQTEKEDEWL